MKILIASDLHLEFFAREDKEEGLFGLTPPDRIILPLDYRVLKTADADLIVLAGDIITLRDQKQMAWLKDFADCRFKRPVIYVLGNHEHYGCEIRKTCEQARAFFAGSNVLLLDNDTAIIDGVRFIGSTLWTDYQAAGNSQSAMAAADSRLNDARMIRIEIDGEVRSFRAKEALVEHLIARQFLESELTKPFKGRTVVVTHHAPSVIHGRHPNYPLDALAGAFSSDLEALFPFADLWIWGHTHASVDKQVGKTRLVSNQRGYPAEQVPGGYDPVKTVVV